MIVIVLRACALLGLASAAWSQPQPAVPDSTGPDSSTAWPVGTDSAAFPRPPIATPLSDSTAIALPAPLATVGEAGPLFPVLDVLPAVSAVFPIPVGLLGDGTSATAATWYASVMGALERAGISGFTTYLLREGGLAILTPFQCTDPGGKPRTPPGGDGCGECGNIWARIIGAPRCHYRAFVFAFSPSLPPVAPRAGTRDEIDSLRVRGAAGGLPESSRALAASGLEARLYVCEYECTDGGRGLQFVSPSPTKPRDHVTKSRLWSKAQVQGGR